MSFDFLLTAKCSHHVEQERCYLASDRKSLPTAHYVAGTSALSLWANDMEIPPIGVQTPAQLASTKAGPFELTADTKTFRVVFSGGQQEFTLPVPTRSRFRPEQVVREVRKTAQGFAVEVVNGHLVFTDGSRVGPEAFMRIEGPAAEGLGFGSPHHNTSQYAARGTKLFPAWDLWAFNATSNPAYADRYPRFREKVMSNPVFRVDYTTIRSRCLRCRGTGVENDIQLAETGDPIFIENEDLLYQAALKILLTTIGTNADHPEYGSTVKSQIGTKAVLGVTAAISESVRRALSNLQAYQRQQAKYQPVSPKERLYAILVLNVTQDSDDPTLFYIELVLQNASGEPVTLNIVYTAPGVVALPGTNGLSAGL
jgi:hypothetical protein